MSTPPAKAPDKPAKKTPAKKAPAKTAKAPKKAQHAAPKKGAAKKAAAKKAPAKKAPAKKAPAKPLIETNGQIAAAAKDAAAHAKSTIEAASNPVSEPPAVSAAGRSPVPWAVAIALTLLALLLVRQLRRRDD
jgi:cobalamin biosynthesis Mg chelatase CobN